MSEVLPCYSDCSQYVWEVKSRSMCIIKPSNNLTNTWPTQPTCGEGFRTCKIQWAYHEQIISLEVSLKISCVSYWECLFKMSPFCHNTAAQYIVLPLWYNDKIDPVCVTQQNCLISQRSKPRRGHNSAKQIHGVITLLLKDKWDRNSALQNIVRSGGMMGYYGWCYNWTTMFSGCIYALTLTR